LAGSAAEAVLSHKQLSWTLGTFGLDDLPEAKANHALLAQLMGDKAERLNELGRRAVNFVRRERRAIEAVASALLQNGTLSGVEVQSIASRHLSSIAQQTSV